jgi:hypothetical protein
MAKLATVVRLNRKRLFLVSSQKLGAAEKCRAEK